MQSLLPLSPEDIKRLDRLAQLSDDEIDCSDIPPLDKEWFENATLVPAVSKSGSRDISVRRAEAMAEKVEAEMNKQKKPISLRVDLDVLNWFKAQGPRYQSRMNAVLKAYMESHPG